MTPDEARDLMSDAFEGELDDARRAAFEAAIAADPELAAEWRAFQEGMRRTRAVGLDVAPSVRLLGGVQRRIRARSRGRFYRDKFATLRRGDMLLPVVLGVTTLLLFAVAWVALRYVEIAPP